MKLLATFLITILSVLNAWSQSDLKTDYFFKALKEQKYRKIDKYLAAGIDVNAPKIEMGHYKGDNFISNQSRTPLLYAIEMNQPKLVEYLISKGADVNQELEVFRYEVCEDCGWSRKLTQTYHKKTIVYKPMEWALKSDNLELIKVMVDSGGNYNGLEEHIKKCKNDKVWDYFMELNVDLDFNAHDLEYHYLSFGPGKRLLLDSTIIPNARTLNQMAKWSDTLSIQIAIEHGADINGMYQSEALKMCPLCKAVFECNLSLTKLLIEKYNANPNPVCSFYSGPDFFKGTPLDLSQYKWGGKCKGRSDEMTEYLLLLK